MSDALPFAHAVNGTDRTITVPRRQRIGTLCEYDQMSALLVDPIAEPLVRTRPMSPSPKPVRVDSDFSTSAVDKEAPTNANPTHSTTKLPNGITVYGSEDVVQRYRELVDEFHMVFEDRGLQVDINT
ncbi:hypothetical protein FQN53_008345 [Emmonsiellopsis sp. PD_33]|nr:hypothetical protein FQN53_008345 [Emmonsiellopsis sp. PD_33]